MPTIMRDQRLAFMEVDGLLKLMGFGITDWTIAGNAKTADKQYVHQRVGTSGLTGYAPSMSVTAEGYSGDPVMDYIMDLGRTWKIGAEASTKIVIVDTWDGPATARTAVEQPVTITIDNPGSGAAGEALSVTATITFDGEPTEGTFDEASLTFTAVGA